jgi:GT2 family glycosyltransferase
MTRDCLRSGVAETGGAGYEIIVVDNASSDGSAGAIAEWIETELPGRAPGPVPPARLIRLEENIGFGRGNNVAAAEARGAFLLLLNPDTLLQSDAVAEVMAFASRRPQARIWGGRTLFADGSLNPSSCWGDTTLWSLLCETLGLNVFFPRSALFNPTAYGGWERDREREVDIVTGCFLLIERDFWHELDGFDPDFFMYSEEADLCYRARLRGARPAITPAATLVHHDGASDRILGPKAVRLFRGRMTYLRKHWTGPRYRLGGFLIELRALGRAVAFGLAGRATGRQSYRESADQWWHVWRHRDEWRKGY